MSVRKTVECAHCGHSRDEPSDVPAGKRQACPECGSTARQSFGEAHDTIQVDGTTRGEVERGLNDIRLAVVGVLVTIALSAAALADGPWWRRLLVGVSSFVLASFVLAYRRTRHLLMDFAHRLTGR